MPSRAGDPWSIVVLPIALFVCFLIIGGLGIAVLGATIAFLVIAPAYLIHRIRHPGDPEPKDEAARARDATRSFRTVVAYNAAVCLSALVVAVVRPAELEGRQWTVALLLFAGLSLSSTLYIWAVAAPRTTAGARRRALALGGLVDTAVCLSAAIAAIGNHVDQWLGGLVWTLGLAAVSVVSALSALSCFHRLRVFGDAER